MTPPRPTTRIALCLLLLATASWTLAKNPREEGDFPYTKSTGVKPGTTLTEAEPIYAGTGQFRESWPLLSLGGPVPVEFTLLYAPDLQFRTPVNNGRVPFPPGFTVAAFTSNTMVRMVDFEDRDQEGDPVYANVLLADDTAAFREVSEGLFASLEPEGYELRKVGDAYFFLNPVLQRVLVFRSRYLGIDFTYPGQPSIFVRNCGEVEWVFDRNGNSLHYTYDARNNPLRIEDGLGRWLEFTYDAQSGFMTSVSDGRGRAILFHYITVRDGETLAQRLDGFTDASGHRTSLHYTSGGLLTRIVRPLGNCPVDQTWGPGPQQFAVSSQRDAFGNETTVSLPAPSGSEQGCTFTFPDGTARTFAHRDLRYPVSYTDEAGRMARFTRDASNRLTAVEDTQGALTSLAHIPCGQVASVTDPSGHTTTFTYETREQTFTEPERGESATFTFYDLSRVDYPGGTSATFTRDARGNLLAVAHGPESTWSYTYDSRGNTLTETTPLGGTSTATYNPDGTVASRTDPDTGTTLFGYDPLGRPERVTFPDGSAALLAWDASDRLLSVRDEAGGLHGFEYDANGNLVVLADPAGASRRLAYDAMDRAERLTDRTGEVFQSTFNPFGNPATEVDPTGVTTAFTYEARGWLTGRARAGYAFSFAYDDEGRLTGHTAPGGASTLYQYDAAGQLTRIADPLGGVTAATYDSGGRLLSTTDPLGGVTTYAYDGRGFLAGVQEPGALACSIARNALGAPTGITDPGSGLWAWGYSPAGRLISSADPLGRTTTHTYDARGRIETTVLPDGDSVQRTFDAAGNLMRRAYASGPEFAFTYDALGRMTGAESASYAYDAEGRPTSARYGAVELTASYDPAGRLREVTYPGGVAVTYAYDAQSGLLRRVSDSLSGAWVEVAYGPDMRPATWTRSNGVGGSWTWDLAGRLARVREGDFLDLTYAYDAAGSVTSVTGAWPLDPAEHLDRGVSSWTYDGACQTEGRGYAFDPRGRQTAAPGHAFTWDPSSRVTACDGATFTYDGTGALLTRTVGGQTTRTYPHPALPGTPAAAELGPEGTWSYSVWLPDGELAYRVEVGTGEVLPSVRFYHFDRNGHTLALTDGGGAVTDRYAYDPYGKLLSHAGPSRQPHTFQGRHGCRSEGGSGDLYEVGARFYCAPQGRFLAPDPLGPAARSLRTLNPYPFAFQDPASFSDFAGLSPIDASARDLLWWDLRTYGVDTALQDELLKIDMADSETRRELERQQAAWDLHQLRSIAGTQDPGAVFESALAYLKQGGALDWVGSPLAPAEAIKQAAAEQVAERERSIAALNRRLDLLKGSRADFFRRHGKTIDCARKAWDARETRRGRRIVELEAANLAKVRFQVEWLRANSGWCALQCRKAFAAGDHEALVAYATAWQWQADAATTLEDEARDSAYRQARAEFP